jgi:hypothetical protein
MLRERLIMLLSLAAAALWWCSLTTLGALVVPLLFATLPTPALAGNMAARLFSAQTWVSLGCGLTLLMVLRSNRAAAPVQSAAAAMLFVAAGMMLALLQEFAVAPHIVARDNLALWHRVGSVMFVLQWLCAVGAFVRVALTRPPIQGDAV